MMSEWVEEEEEEQVEMLLLLIGDKAIRRRGEWVK